MTQCKKLIFFVQKRKSLTCGFPLKHRRTTTGRDFLHATALKTRASILSKLFPEKKTKKNLNFTIKFYFKKKYHSRG